MISNSADGFIEALYPKCIFVIKQHILHVKKLIRAQYCVRATKSHCQTLSHCHTSKIAEIILSGKVDRRN